MEFTMVNCEFLQLSLLSISIASFCTLVVSVKGSPRIVPSSHSIELPLTLTLHCIYFVPS